MKKTTEALKLAEEALVDAKGRLESDLRFSDDKLEIAFIKDDIADTDKALAAIREALAEPDWYEEAMRLGGLNAKHVGELKQLRAEPVKQEVHQEPVAYKYKESSPETGEFVLADPVKRPQNCGTGYCSCIECPYDPVKQEPVAWKHDCSALCTNDVQLWIDQCPHCGKPRYAAPVDAKAIREAARAEALEEAAKVCEEGTALTYFQSTDCYNYAHNRAEAIRSLK